MALNEYEWNILYRHWSGLYDSFKIRLVSGLNQKLNSFVVGKGYYASYSDYCPQFLLFPKLEFWDSMGVAIF